MVPSQINELPDMNHLKEEAETPAIAFAVIIADDSSRDIEKERGRAEGSWSARCCPAAAGHSTK